GEGSPGEKRASRYTPWALGCHTKTDHHFIQRVVSQTGAVHWPYMAGATAILLRIDKEHLAMDLSDLGGLSTPGADIQEEETPVTIRVADRDGMAEHRKSEREYTECNNGDGLFHLYPPFVGGE